PLEDLAGFRTDLELLAEAMNHDPVVFPCMDEWVHGFADSSPTGLQFPFAGRESIDTVLDKASLYNLAAEYHVSYPKTYRIASTLPETTAEGPSIKSAEAAADSLGFPLVVKPALKREFEEVMGTNVTEVADRAEYRSVIEDARTADIRLMAQERIDVATGRDCSVVSYRPQSGDPVAMVGNARVRYPLNYGTSCVVDHVNRPALREQAMELLAAADYHGISEAEFIYDLSREEYVLIDINTRPWKWISLPVAAGYDLPWAAYSETVNGSKPSSQVTTTTDRWVYLPD
ncbi:MAG: carboxylate--amine ligase, partial [Halobacteriaceae archaeon]